MNRNEQILALADRQLDGTATPDDVSRLAELLTNDPVAQALYLRYSLVHGQLGMTPTAMQQLTASAPSDVSFSTLNEPPPTGWKRWAAAVSVAIAASVAFVLWMSPSNAPQQDSLDHLPDVQLADASLSHYDNRQPPIGTVGKLGENDSGPMTLSIIQGETEFASSGGANVRVTGPALFGVNSPQGGVLYNGSVHAKLESPQSRFSVTTSNLRVVDMGTEFQVAMLDDRHIRVQAMNGQVDVQSRVRLPSYYWHFDDREGADSVDAPSISTPMTLGEHAQRVPGIVGRGAVRFDNSQESFVQIDEGMGTEVGNGLMACSSGITLEAMFISEWSGELLDYDEIFRKEDGVYRILLSFQNDDDVGDYDFPEIAPGPCLSFGLHIEQQGYSELDMPLDGRDGRPTVEQLTDGKPHHVVATYDSFSGRKALYIDGKLCFQHQFPVGGLILSGGSAPAVIGNMWRMREPFAGVLDEVALYDFPLTAEEIALHFENAAAGICYFGDDSHGLAAERWKSITLVTAGTQRVFDKLTGLPVDVMIP
ncbi:LamG domain-containing protein [Blastopirellula sp. J2-11]|uniref:LamG domain-containing protein n=1 Tax=Blastopirellula sp. J2-11 TaxID=2943192 RepID=UPI0021C851D7|nr:LamG domain-containing protein [Blastopirellula sp. J2-11]UUO05361.1 LamG domain-containing protein [Blastopirellula sp. J2-11]